MEGCGLGDQIDATLFEVTDIAGCNRDVIHSCHGSDLTIENIKGATHFLPVAHDLAIEIGSSFIERQNPLPLRSIDGTKILVIYHA